MSAVYTRLSLGGIIVLLLIGGPRLYYNYRNEELRNFHVVRPGMLYRSGQLSLEGLKRVIHDYRIKTVVTLREARVPGEPHPDLEEEDYCRSKEIYHFRLPPRGWVARSDGTNPADERTRRFCEIMSDPRHFPVLVHCYAGKHRTGAYVAVYRMECEGWSNAKAMAEMVQYGYDNLDDHEDLEQYLRDYRPTGAYAQPTALRAQAPGSTDRAVSP